MNVQTEQELVALCLALIGGQGCLSAAERKLAKAAPASALKPRDIDAIRKAISRGGDPLGEAFSLIRSAADRRAAGAVYTPAPIVRSMMTWLASQGAPARILGRVHQWIGSTGEHRHVLAASDFAQFQRIAHRVAETDVARRHSQADHVVALVGKSHQQRQRVVHAGVSVDQQGNLLAHFLHRF